MRLTALTTLTALLWSGIAVAQMPPRVVMAPVEKALERVSFGPHAGVAPTVGFDGPGVLLSLGFGAVVFDLWGVPDPVCEARRREERAALGGDRIKLWGRVLDRTQQPCRLLEQGWRPAYDFGAELGFGTGFGPVRTGQLRGYFAPVAFGDFTLGLSAAGVAGERPDGSSALGLRLGPELAWHRRFDRSEKVAARHVLSVVLRPEASLLSTDALPHQVVLGARFLFDL